MTYISRRPPCVTGVAHGGPHDGLVVTNVPGVYGSPEGGLYTWDGAAWLYYGIGVNGVHASTMLASFLKARQRNKSKDTEGSTDGIE